MRNLLNSIKKGIGKMRDKTVEKILDIGSTLKNKENRVIIGIIILGIGIGVGGSFIISGYVPMPQQS